jgi:hypothetical protein
MGRNDSVRERTWVMALDFRHRFRYGRGIEARYPSGKGEVCKTFMRGFDSHPRLQHSR